MKDMRKDINKPKVTVIVTVYKRTKFLRQALQSALDQNYFSYEIIVTDDSCSESVKEIVDSFKNPLIKYRCNTSTLGVALNLRAAINEALGEYISILNDDDVWEADFLKSLVKPLEEDEDCVLSFSDHWIISEDGTIQIKETIKNTIFYGRSTLAEGNVEQAVNFLLHKNGIPLAMA